MPLGDAQGYLDPQGGETQQYITAQDIKDSYGVIYTDLGGGSTNLLTENQASVETDLEGWAAGSYLPTIERSTEQALHGSASIKVTATSASGAAIIVSPVSSYWAPVIEGQVYTASCWVKCGTNARAASVTVDWRNSSDGSIGVSTPVQIATNTSGWTRVDATVVAPAGAVNARMAVNFYTPALNDTFYVDALGLWAGAGGEWAMPGNPITNLGTKVTHPNTDDVLVQRWDSSLDRWQTVHYDSGWRDISADWPPFTGSTLNFLKLRRINDQVTLGLSANQVGQSSPTSALIPVQYGFRGSVDTNLETVDTGGNRTGIVGIASGGANVFHRTVADMNCRAELSWVTDDPPPTSLPGTLVSAAPA